MKKSLSLLVAIAMVFSMFATVVSAADQTAGEKLKELGVITGTSEGLQEDAEWRRADVAILVSRLYGKEAEAKATTPNHGFTDLTDKTYGAYVTWAKEEGLFLGKTETTFGPLDNITNGQFATVVLRALKQDQKDEAKNLEKAIELKLLAEGTVQTDAAKRGVTYSALVAALDVEVEGKKLGNILGLKGYEIVDLAVASASAVVGKTIKVEFNDDIKALATTDVTVVDVDGNNVPVQKVTFEGKVATVTLATALAQKAHTVKIAKATSVEGSALANGSAEFTYTKGIPASVAVVNTTVAVSKAGSDRFVQHVVKDANGVDITEDFPLSVFQRVSSHPAVIDNDFKAVGVGMSVVNLKLSENNEITTGNVTINVVDALTLAISDVKLNNDTNNIVHLLASNAANDNNRVIFTVKDQNGTAVAPKTASLGAGSDGYTVTYTSSNPTVASVTNDVVGSANHGKVTALQAGTATITAVVEYGAAKATTTLTVTVKDVKKASSFTLDKTNVTVVNNTYLLPQAVKVTVYDQYGDVYKVAGISGTIENNAPGKVTVAGTFTTSSDGTASVNVTAVAGQTGSANLTFKFNAPNEALGTKVVTATAVNQHATLAGYEVVVSESKLDADPNTVDPSKAAQTSASIKVYVKDANGNRAFEITGSDFSNNVSVTQVNNLLSYAGGNLTVVDNTKRGTETVTVKYNNIVIGSHNIEVVATSPSVVTKVVQEKSSVNVGVGTFTVIGNGSLDAFTGYNVYDEKVATAAIESAISANNSVVSVSGTTLTANAAGTTLLTIKINGTFYTLTVVVQ